MTNTLVLALDQIDGSDVLIVGSKAANLAALRRNGLPIPTGFVIPATVFQTFVDDQCLGPAIAEVERRGRELPGDVTDSPELKHLRSVLAQAELPIPVVNELRRAFVSLVDETGSVAVRSSALGEDTADASFAGQQLTVLNVRRFDDFLHALRRCWASLFQPTAVCYRARIARQSLRPAMAVIAQVQVLCEVAGTLFTVDPVSGSDTIVIEGVWGLGEAIAQGEVVPDRYVVSRTTLGDAVPPRTGNKRCQRVPGLRGETRLVPVPVWRRRQQVLTAAQRSALALLGMQIEDLRGAPQDIEWGLAGGRWWIFQARPITSGQPSTDEIASSAYEQADWTSGFLDERLTEPVSPLGWSVLRDGLEEIAFRQPLRMLGVDPACLEPLTRLWNGHPYANVAVFESLYKLFPDWLLPEDARRYFPDGDVARRKQAVSPRSLATPAVVGNLAKAVIADPLAVSPWHNATTWDRFERRYVAALGTIAKRVGALEGDPNPDGRVILGLLDEVAALNTRLLTIHRWSLTHAEVSYSLLRRLVSWLLGPEHAGAYCSSVVRDLGDQSVRLNSALQDLSQVAAQGDETELELRLAEFIRDFGHRSFSLDLMRPSFGEDPGQILALLASTPATGARLDDGEGSPGVASSTFKHPLTRMLAPLAGLARGHARLREDERFAWQRGLALLRTLYLLAGRRLVARKVLPRVDDVFFLTDAEIRRALAGELSDLANVASARAARYATEKARFFRRPLESYPPFLHGNHPAEAGGDQSLGRPSVEPSRTVLRGEPVSPGSGRGRARVVVRPDDLASVQTGEVLVARGADPGWTLVFPRLAALVTESGGQLSHASVVARESRLPAVVAVPRATTTIRTGDELLVDGTTGLVRILAV